MKHVAVSKTEVFNNEEFANMPSLFTINGEVIENVSEFTYLGQGFSNKDQENITELRVSKAVAKFNEGTYRQQSTDNKVRMATRTQVWYIKEDCLRKLESCWMEMLR